MQTLCRWHFDLCFYLSVVFRCQRHQAAVFSSLPVAVAVQIASETGVKDVTDYALWFGTAMQPLGMKETV